MSTTETVAPNRFGDIFGYPKGRAVTKLQGQMTPFVQEFIQHAPFCVLASSDRDGRPQCDPAATTAAPCSVMQG
jgi:predicted pyridoxine 5'-phosphate oxidase superfamily flavin-nucleotide-binding protein